MATRRESTMNEVLPDTLNSKIYTLRGQRVMFDQDLADAYEVETKMLKRAVKRNPARFPSDFMFEPTKQELEFLRCQIGTSKVENSFKAAAKPILISDVGTSNEESEKDGRGGSRYTPFAFSELGVAMLSSVLHSERAVLVNIGIMRAFVQLRHDAQTPQNDLAPKLESIENMFKDRFDRLEVRLEKQILLPVASGNLAAKRDLVGIVQTVVAKHFGVSSEELISSSRTQSVSLPRQIAIFLARKNLSLSFSEIARHFGGRDHTTIMHAYRKIRAQAETNTMIRSAVDVLGNQVQGQLV